MSGDLLEWLLPQRCPACAAPAHANRVLCDACVTRLPRLAHALCARCLRAGDPPAGCVRHPADRVHAAWVYDERVAALVHAFKFGGRPRLAEAIAPVMAEALRDAPRPGLVVAVPLHAARRRERGYDQAALLARALARELAVPWVDGVVARVRATTAQSALGADARRRNPVGAFRLVEPAWVRGREVLVVDDVLTTGATLHEVMRVLRWGGARTRGAVAGWAS